MSWSEAVYVHKGSGQRTSGTFGPRWVANGKHTDTVHKCPKQLATEIC